MKNILIITPFYPFPESGRLLKDTRVVYDLCKYHSEDENIIIMYYYQHTRIAAIQNLPRILAQNNYQQCLYQDDMGHDVLLFEHPGFIPHRYKTFTYFDKKYAGFLQDYLRDRNITIDSIAVHFPSRFTPIAQLIDANNKVAIMHSFDVDREDRMNEMKRYLDEYDSIGYRSKHIEKKLTKDGAQYEGFDCSSGIPDSLLLDIRNDRAWKSDETLKLIYAGKLNKNKNVETIIKSLSQIKDMVKFHFTIIGDGEEKIHLQRQIDDLKLNDHITMTGILPREKVFEHLKMSDVFVLVSHKETLGIAYLEAMATGNIVIGSKDRGIDGLVEDKKEAFFVDPQNPDELADLLLQIDQFDRDKVQKIREACYKYIMTHTDSAVSHNYIKKLVRY